MTKRRRIGDNGIGRNDERPNDEHPTKAAGDVATVVAGGGMSRAAKKRRAKRRSGAAGGGGGGKVGEGGDPIVVVVADGALDEVDRDDAMIGSAKEATDEGAIMNTTKMQLPSSDEDDDDGDDDDDDEERLETAIRKFRGDNDGDVRRREKEGGDGKKKEKMDAVLDSRDSHCDGGNNTEPSPRSSPTGGGMDAKTTKMTTAKRGGRTRGGDSNATDDGKDRNDDDDDDDESSDDGNSELESSLSTLTPLQILMLDGKGKGKGKENTGDVVIGNGTASTSDIADIDPLMLILDVTTRHRARILLSSLLSPSGVSVYEFYQRYWGKRPLLASYEQGTDEIEDQNPDGMGEDDGIRIQDREREYLEHVTRLDGFLDRSIVDGMMRKNKLRYGLDLNVTRFTDILGNGTRQRITLDPPPKKGRKKSAAGARKGTMSAPVASGNDTEEDDDDLEYVVANPTDVWSNVDASSCTLRLLRPHEHNDRIHAMLSLLESEFGCMVGSNAYLTPLHSQGFAPHYDDVDVFILQLEGYKRWMVYAPLNKRETLPRVSSRDYTEKEMEDEEKLMDVTLGPGDVLYLPRGWIHQAETVKRPSSSASQVPTCTSMTPSDRHSLHLTISAMQNWCWADFLDLLMPEALDSAASSDKTTSLREGLPRNFLSFMGTMHHDDDVDDDFSTLPEGLKQAAKAQQARDLVESHHDGEKNEDEEEATMKIRDRQRRALRQKRFKEEAKKRIMRVCKHAMSMLDDACDEIGKRFLSDRLPPALLKTEKSLTKEGISDSDSKSTTRHHHDASKKIWPNTLCRIVRPDVARLVVEDGKAVLYHCLDNSRVYHGTPLSPMEFEIDDAPALEQLLTTVEPHWIMVNDLIHGDVEDKMGIAQTLYDEGLLCTILVNAPDRSVKTG
jgi:lysine-specific demethylase/histidyl-hydroxylase NO66